ncbi:MAG: 30S ribosomal protein S16 [Actinomycetota bacterium]|nr:30S ribosomal protein S16 [Actinomycetota bacterium]
MSVKIRLTRMGFKKKPFYRIVVADSRSPRDGKFIDNIGTYDPKSEPSKIEVDKEKALEWIKKGAKPSNTVQKLFEKINLISSDNK